MKNRNQQKGVVIIEFALSFVVFWTVFMGVIELSRLTFALNSASEATRIAARLGSICSMGHTQQIQNDVQYLIDASGLVDSSTNPNWLELTYLNINNQARSQNDCMVVKASIPNLQFRPLLIPGVNFQLSTNVGSIALRESMTDLVGSTSNPSCS